MKNQLPIFAALDVQTVEQARTLAQKVQGRVKGVKVGPRLYALGGTPFLSELVDRGFDVFLDLKLHDIPNTVAIAVDVFARLGLFCLTVHSSGGMEMCARAVKARDEARSSMKLLGITVLTSLTEPQLQEASPSLSLQQALTARAKLCLASGLDGLVCSPDDLPLLKEYSGDHFIKVTPGVRFAALGDDQQRVTTPVEAWKRGADYLVMGRPIYAAENLDHVMAQLESDYEEAQQWKKQH